MIDGTLILKRFSDKAVAGLFSGKAMAVRSDADKEMVGNDGDAIHPDEILSKPQRKHRLELEDAIRVGLKAGMGSRQNAPAEWIGE